MLRITIEVVPYGIETDVVVLSQLFIWNQRTAPISDYGVATVDPRPDKGAETTLATVRHRRSAGFWPLLAKAAEAMAKVERTTTKPAKI